MNSSAIVTCCDDIIRRLREAIAEHPLSPIHGYAADIAALLDRLDDFEKNGAQAVRWAPSSAHWSNELRRLFGSDAREGVNNLEERLRDAIVKLDAAEAENERLLEFERSAALTLPGVYYMDPPDGGSVPLGEQVRRMAVDAARYRWLRGREDGRYLTVYAFRTDIDEVCLGDELDAAIDAAMAKEA